jgi:hypothetical protein
MKTKKTGITDALVALVEWCVANEPYEAFGFQWAARPLPDYCEQLGVSKWTFRDRTKEPPFVCRSTSIGGKRFCLLRVCEAPPKDANDYRRIMLSMWRGHLEDRNLLYGIAAQEAKAQKIWLAAKPGEYVGETIAQVKSLMAAKDNHESQCLWGFAGDVIKLCTEIGLSKDVEERLILGTFKYALKEWSAVASCIKIAMEATPGGKVLFLDYPSITVIRRFWKAAVYAYTEHWQGMDDKAPLTLWKVLQATNPWIGHPGVPGIPSGPAGVEALIKLSEKTEALMTAKAAKLAAAEQTEGQNLTFY